MFFRKKSGMQILWEAEKRLKLEKKKCVRCYISDWLKELNNGRIKQIKL